MTTADNAARVGKPNQLQEGIVLPQAQNLRTHDNLGLSLDPKNWAKSKCNTCFGQGVYKVHRPMKLGPGVTGSGNFQASTDPCDCALRQYRKIRESMETAILGVWNDPRIEEQKKLDAIQGIISESHARIKNGNAVTVRDLHKVAVELIESRIVKPRR